MSVFALLCGAFVADVLLTTNHLSEPIATHFGLHGEANGWMTRAVHLRYLLGLGLGLPVAILLLSQIITRLGGAGLNIPHRDYWLAPERRAQTLAFAQRMLVWCACLMVVFFALINHLILRANTHAPAALAGAELWLPIALFLAAMAIWTTLFIRPFFRKA